MKTNTINPVVLKQVLQDYIRVYEAIKHMDLYNMFRCVLHEGMDLGICNYLSHLEPNEIIDDTQMYIKQALRNYSGGNRVWIGKRPSQAEDTTEFLDSLQIRIDWLIQHIKLNTHE